jgi:hypothetical protein
MANRRIIVLLDGTWNEDVLPVRQSNIVRIRNHIAASLDADISPKDTTTSPSSRVETYPRTFEGREYVVFYQRGVGTGPFDRLTGGVFGSGLGQNVRRAFRFLAFHFQAGDELFIFGFSRGAYTARSLAGLIGAVGLLSCDTCTAANEALAWSFYRTPPNDRLSGTWVQLEPLVHSRREVQIACLALFDTVGALGVPIEGFRRLNRREFEFHDVELSPLVKFALHALAIDEQRQPFEASVWRRNSFRRTDAIVEQVWFPGVHSDIGGGYLNDDDRAQAWRALDDLTLDWMFKRLKAQFPDFPVPTGLGLSEGTALGPLHDSRTWTYRLSGPPAVRSLGNQAPVNRLLQGRQVMVGHDPYGEATGEAVHIRAIHNLGTEVLIPGGRTIYAPANLVAQLPNLLWLYAKDAIPTDAPAMLRLTGIDGVTIPQRGDDAVHAHSTLRLAATRLRDHTPYVRDWLATVELPVPLD